MQASTTSSWSTSPLRSQVGAQRSLSTLSSGRCIRRGSWWGRTSDSDSEPQAMSRRWPSSERESSRYRGCRLLTDGTQPSSSTLIRHAVAEGDFGRVRELSDNVFRFSGVVVRGDRRGHELGFPTANVPVPPGLAVPADGVYAGWVTRLDGDSPRWPAAISVGTNPTFDGVERRVEAYVLDRDDLELYDVEIAIDFYARLRGQVKYAGREALIKQMHADVEEARHLLHAA